MHEVEGATWCEPRRRDGRLRQARASPVCARSRGRVRLRHRRRRERRWRGAEDRGGHGDAVAYGSRSLSREQRPGRLSQLGRGLMEYRNMYSDIPLIGGRRCSVNRGPKGAAPFGACKGGAGGNGGDRPCPLVPVPVCGPASSGQGSLRNG